jgi:arylsulfatase A-like enzyme
MKPITWMKFLLGILILSYVIGVFSFVRKTPTLKPTTPPNLLIILVDQWTGHALGFENREPVLTPNLDALSKRSLVLEQMVSNYPVCSPARAMLMTGKYPLKNHVYSNVNSSSAPFGIELPKDIVCWSDVLKSNGYSNGYIGKWHLDSPHEPYIPTSNNIGKVAWNEWTPPDRRHGFDYWYAYGTYDVHNRPMYWDTKAPRDSFHYVDEWGPTHEAKKALAFLRNDDGQFRENGKPFSLVVSMNPPHSDYKTVPENYYNIYKDRPMETFLRDPNIPDAGTPMGKEYRNNIKYYYANMTGVDDQVGHILQGLKDNKLDDNTIVVFMADHGNCLGKHNEISKNNIYEESLSIPFIIYWKGHILPRIDNTFLGSIPDLYPTFLDLMGLKSATPSDLDGLSYADYFKNGSGKKPANQYIMGAIISNEVNINSGFRGIRTKNYTFGYVKKDGKTESVLFDLVKDPFELHNIYDPKSDVVKKFRKELIRRLKETKDGFQIPDK